MAPDPTTDHLPDIDPSTSTSRVSGREDHHIGHRHIRDHDHDSIDHSTSASQHHTQPLIPDLSDMYTRHTRPLGTSRTLGSIVRGFKIGVTKPFRKLPGNEKAKLWHRNYYESIIRDERALHNIRRYIHNNPRNWNKSRQHKKS